MTTKKLVKIIPNVGSTISTERLEEASTKLLLARIRSETPKVSFSFIQRLLDEVIQRRRQELADLDELDQLLDQIDFDTEPPNFDESTDLFVSNDTNLIVEQPFNFDELEFNDLPLATKDNKIKEEEEEEEEEKPIIPKPKKRAVLAYTHHRRRSWVSGIGWSRVFILSILAILIIGAGALFA
jgi:hypothetical protein